MIPRIVAAISAVYSAETTINLYQEMKRNEMKYVEKKITESAEYAYFVCKYEQTKSASQKSHYTGYVMPILSFVFDNSIGILYHTPPTNTLYYTHFCISNAENVSPSSLKTPPKVGVSNDKWCKTINDTKMSDVAINYFNDKYSTPKFYINTKLSDKHIHKLIDSELKLIVAKNKDTAF